MQPATLAWTWICRSALLALSLLLAACGSPVPARGSPIPPPTRPAGTDNPVPGIVAASGILVPVRTTKMEFAISAPVNEVLVREGDRVHAGQKLITLDVLDLEFSVAGAEAAVRAAQAEADYQKAPRKTRDQNGSAAYVGAPPELQEAADARLRLAQASLAQAQAVLAQATLTAPFDGTVVAIEVGPGQYARPGQVVVTLGDLDQLQIETTDLGELEIIHLKVGQTIHARVDALDRELTGKVIAISPRAQVVGGEVVYKVTIALDQQAEGLRWGMKAEVEIQTGE